MQTTLKLGNETKMCRIYELLHVQQEGEEGE